MGILALVTNRYTSNRLWQVTASDLRTVARSPNAEVARREMRQAELRGKGRYVAFYERTDRIRGAALASFSLSCPLQLLSAAASQFDTLPDRVAVPTAMIILLSMVAASLAALMSCSMLYFSFSLANHSSTRLR